MPINNNENNRSKVNGPNESECAYYWFNTNCNWKQNRKNVYLTKDYKFTRETKAINIKPRHPGHM